MNRRTMLQYLASIAAGGASIGQIAGCVAGAPQSTERKPGAGTQDKDTRGADQRNGDTRTDDRPTEPSQTSRPSASSNTTSPSLRKLRSQNMYVANPIAPGVNLRQFGFKRAVMLPAKVFTDGDGMSVRPKLLKAISERIAQVGEADFRGPFIFDLEGPMFSAGLSSDNPREWGMAARRMNSALEDLRSIIPDAIVSVYASPFLKKTREDYATASRSVRRLNQMTFFNPSLYQTATRKDKEDIDEQARVRRDYVEFACNEAKRMGVEYVFPMVYHRYKGAAQANNEDALTLIPREEFQAVQIKSARDGGAQGIVLWHADLQGMRLSRKREPQNEIRAREKKRTHFETVTPEQLAQTHRDVLQSINEAFLNDG